MMLRRAQRTIVAVLALVLGSGCTNTEPDTEVLRAGDVAVLKESEDYTGDVGGVGVDGTIAIVEGCLGMGGRPDPVVIVFPPSTSVSGEGDELVVEIDGVSLRVGDEFSASSRSSSERRLDDFGSLATQAPESCRGLNARALDEFN